jgi:hypothetical protein
MKALMARLGDIVFDAAHPASLARFWAAALDGYSDAPYDDEELARLRANVINGRWMTRPFWSSPRRPVHQTVLHPCA